MPEIQRFLLQDRGPACQSSQAASPTPQPPSWGLNAQDACVLSSQRLTAGVKVTAGLASWEASRLGGQTLPAHWRPRQPPDTHPSLPPADISHTDLRPMLAASFNLTTSLKDGIPVQSHAEGQMLSGCQRMNLGITTCSTAAVLLFIAPVFRHGMIGLWSL